MDVSVIFSVMTSLIKPIEKQRVIVLHLILLLGWLTIGTALRFYCLECKPPWSDEWATIVFSLGHSFLSIPLDRVISSETLLQPLQVDGVTSPVDVVTHLIGESTHPPMYFVLTHWWVKLFSKEGELISLGVARSLSAFFGVVGIPAMFAWGWLALRSPSGAHLAAALMAVSSMGVYLAQEARHYTLAILWAIASLACFLVAVRYLQSRLCLPSRMILVWVGVNSLGIATHYFFSLLVIAQILVLLRIWLLDCQKDSKTLFCSYWLRIYIVITGTLTGMAVWLSAWQKIPDNNLVEWVDRTQRSGIAFLEPIGRLLVWIVTMLFLLPLERVPFPIAIASAVTLMLFLGWLVPAIARSLRVQRQKPSTSLVIQTLTEVVLGAIAIVLLITYATGKDITLAARFQFFYFPAIILLMAATLAHIWQESSVKSFNFLNPRINIIFLVLIMSFLGGITVVSDLGFQKPDRPDLVVSTI